MGTPRHNPNDVLIRTLTRLRRRLTVQLTVRYALHGVWIGATMALVWVIVSRLFPVLGDPTVPAAAVFGLSTLIGGIVGFARRPTLLQTALEADRRLELRERITSSLELAEVDGPMVAALHADARRILESRDASEHFRFVTPRVLRWALVPVLLFGVAYVFLPEFDLLGQRERAVEARQRAEATNVRVERLKEAARPLADAELANDAELADLLGQLDGLATDLESGAITEKQALARLGNLAEKLRQQRLALAATNPDLRLRGDRSKLSVTRELANALQQGRLGEAAQKAAEIQKKLETASPEDREKLRQDLEALADMIKESDSALGEALARAMTDASTAIENGAMDQAQASLEDMLNELQDAQSIMDQLEQMDSTMQQLAEWQADNLGPSDYCRQCGTELSECDAESGQCDSAGHKHSGHCSACAAGNGWGRGTGMGGSGQGEGNEVGELPEVEVGLTPTKAKGQITRGRMLAEILQRSAPEPGEEPTVEALEGAFVELHQEAEQALVKEEIPPASKEYVRQYFGSIEPDASDANQ